MQFVVHFFSRIKTFLKESDQQYLGGLLYRQSESFIKILGDIMKASSITTDTFRSSIDRTHDKTAKNLDTVREKITELNQDISARCCYCDKY